MMRRVSARLGAFYERVILERPRTVLAIIVVGMAWFAQHFSLDASADSLTLEGDADLDYYRQVRARYGTDDYLIVTYSPRDELFSDAVLEDLAELRDNLSALDNIVAVTSILDVPLVASPPVNLRDIGAGVRYLRDPATDRELARAELTGSPLYRDLIINSDGTTTALRVDLAQDERFSELRDQRDTLRERRFAARLSDEESRALAYLSNEVNEYGRRLSERHRQDIAAVRTAIDAHRDTATLHLGGVPMIVVDSMDFIRSDLVVFGAALLLFLIAILAASFKKRRWVMLPLLTCFATCVSMIGLLGMLNWRVTVVSSNFVSLMLILCLALTLHIIVRYRELHENNPEADQRTLVGTTVRKIVIPCFYTALTTIVAFGSLMVSDIRPVIDFGWMMAIGIGVAFVLSFTLFPAALMLLEPGRASSRNDLTGKITSFFAELVRDHRKAVLVAFVFVVTAGLAGASRLTVENRFIDYYKRSTGIYQGMELIDRELGGTTPLDVVIDAPVNPDEGGTEDGFDDLFAEESEAGITASSYWFNRTRLDDVRSIHRFLDGLEQTGKVVSIGTFADILYLLDPGVLQDNLFLSIVYARLPPEIERQMVEPYMSADGDQLRFGIRVFESDPELQRAALLGRIREGLVGDFGIADSDIHLSGMLVLYNNMLKSLFRSQILTLGVVFLAIVLMFLALFRSFKFAFIGIVPNVSAACIVLGLMGWAGIPLDLMTITIAAITVGIGVDDTIHYIHRFRREFAADHYYWPAVRRCHRSIGRAIYYTSVTIMLGFSILALSSFVPTIYFGLLTGLAMLVALIANMTLLPALIVTFHAAD